MGSKATKVITDKTCDFGCGQLANYQFKNGRKCCSQSHNQCPALKKKNKKGSKKRGRWTAQNNPNNIKASCLFCKKVFGFSNIFSHEKVCPFKPGNKKYCKECGKLLVEKTQAKFCSRACAGQYNNRRRLKQGYTTKGKTTIKKCSGCDKEIEVSIHANNSKVLCLVCGEKRYKYKSGEKQYKCKTCKICGKIPCVDKKVCNWLRYGGIPNFVKIGGDVTKIGSTDIIKETYKVAEDLYFEYQNGASSTVLGRKYNILFDSVLDIFKRFDFVVRTPSEALVNAFEEGRLNQPYLNNFKQGYHKTWFDEKVFLRSSQEFDYAKKLDKQQKYYKVEPFGISYYWKGVLHTYIPDFYLPADGLIIEVKGSYFYKIGYQKIKAKLEACKTAYDIKLIIDGQELDLNKIPLPKQI